MEEKNKNQSQEENNEEEKKNDEQQSRPEITHPEEGDVACEQCLQYKRGWKRALADYDNLQKNLAKEKQSMRLRVKEDMVQSLLPVLDNFDQAVKFKPEGLDKKTEGWLTGILHVQKQLQDVLASFGANPFGEAGDDFDTNLHDAASEESDEDKPDQTVLEVVRRGWKMEDRVIRPAKVIVNNLEEKDNS